MKFKRRKRNQQGSTLLIALFLIFLIAVLMISLSMLHRSDLEIVSNQIDDLAAYYCAEAGIERTIYEIRKFAFAPNWPPGNNTAPGVTVWNNEPCVTNTTQGMVDKSSTYTVVVVEDKADSSVPGNRYNYVWITSTGATAAPRTYQRTLRVLVRRAGRWQLIPFAVLTYQTQILQYREL